MDAQLVQRAHWGDLEGMNLAGLVRLSFEVNSDGKMVGRPYLTGRDIKGRDEQEKDCLTYTRSRKGHYVYTYEEPDTSAYRRKRVVLPDGRIVYRVIRPILEGALNDLKLGRAPNGDRLDGLIVYDIDRLTRDNRHLEDCIEVVQHFGRPIIDITGTLDLLTDNGRTVARILVATNNKQSADTGRRVRRKHEALQQAGIPTGGRRPFGWNHDKRTLNPPEAAAIRDGAKRILGGAPVTAIVERWNKAGLLTPWGNRWVKHPVKRLFRNPRICGLRSREVHDFDPDTGKETVRVEVVRDASGQPVKGLWEPIVSVAEWEALKAVLGENPVAGRGENARKYLLTGTLRCGREGCGALLRAGTRRGKAGKKLWYYVCPSSGMGGCGGVSIPGPLTDQHVEEAVIAKLELEARRRGVKQAQPAWPQEDELALVRRDLEELTAAWRARPQRISSTRYFALLPELERDERRLARERDRWLAKQHSSSKDVSLRVREEWPEYTLAEKRTYIEMALVAVTVAPSNGLKRWNPDRLVPLWREED